MTFPLARYRDGGDVMFFGPDGEISAAAFFSRATELAACLPDAPFVINLSESRVGFMLGFAAALIRGQTSLLPSGQGRGDWAQLAEQYPNASIISDRANIAPQSFDLSPYLAFAESQSFSAPIPDIPADLIAAILFTSGSTGNPTAHAKSWGKLSTGAANLMVALDWTQPVPYGVVGSVAPQHMFGLETTVMLPWQAGIPVHTSKPLLPADLETALAQCPRDCWWMTTPMHLRPPLQTTTNFGNLAGIVASTLSLPVAIAKAAEEKWMVPVVEIYGSTETGALASRRTALDEWWTPLRDVKLHQQGGGEVSQMRSQILASGSHIDVPVPLGDELRLNPDGRFLWLGRSADMLKVGGKRASLSALNQQISEIAGVDDGCYFVPGANINTASHDEAHPARRLAAFFVSATLSHEQLRAALRDRIDPVFVPRHLYRVPQLPRDANGKLAHAALALLFSEQRLTEGAAGNTDGSGTIQLVVPMRHPALAGHFPGNPIVPGVTILAQITDHIHRQLPQLELGTLLRMRFHTPLRPDQPFMLQTEINDDRLDVKVHLTNAKNDSGTLIASGQWACRVRAGVLAHR